MSPQLPPKNEVEVRKIANHTKFKDQKVVVDPNPKKRKSELLNKYESAIESKIKQMEIEQRELELAEAKKKKKNVNFDTKSSIGKPADARSANGSQMSKLSQKSLFMSNELH